MSDTVSSQFNAKNQDDQVRSLIGERGRWTMSSGQMPPGGAGGYPPTQTHHLPPTVPNPTPNASSLPQRLRMPPNTPPAHQHMPPWRHSPAASQATGLGALPSGLHTYFGSPHLAGRAGMTAWQAAAAKPAGAHSAALGAHAANPLFSLQSLQMMVNADLPGSAPAPDYQQETMDLSSHSEARRSPKKDTLLRNGGNNCIMSNGEMAATAADLSAAKSSPLDSVSVIAQNPLRETVPEVLNCSSKPDVRSEKAAEFPSEPHTKVDKASPLPSPASPEPAASAPPVPEQKTTELNRAVQTSVPENKPTELNQPTHTPVIENKSTELIRAVHTPDNVESILENMFRIQEDKQQTPANSSSPLVTPHSVIVSNDTRTTHHDNSISVSNISKEVPVSSPPEKINEQKLIEILKVEEDGDHLREGVSKKDSKEDMEEVKKENVIETKHDESKTDSVSVKDEVVMIAEDVVEKPNVTSSTVEDVTMDNDDNTVVISESEDESNTTRESSAVKSESKVKDEPDSMFTEVESELEKMFAGIVEPGSEVAVKEEVAGGSGVQGNKRRGRPKGALGAARRSSDTSFSGVDSASKKRKGKESETGKKGGKKVRIDVESSNQLARKGRPTSLAGTDQGKSRGPVVHVEGSRDNPTSVVVVNGTRGQDEDDANEKSGAAKASFRKQRAIFQTEAKTRGAQSAGLYNSTLSSRYDSLVADSTWLCVLCKRGPHYEPCAGDLFGPYVVQLSPPTASGGGSLPPPCDYDLAAEQKRRAGPGKMAAASLRATGGGEGFAQKAAKKHKRSVSMDVDRQMSGLVPMEGGAGEYEVWVHEACAVWAPGVYMIGARLIGLQDAVADAIKTRCSGCGEPGASIGCIARGCRQLLHLGCARRAAWHLDQHNFISKCSQHANTLLHTEYGRR